MRRITTRALILGSATVLAAIVGTSAAYAGTPSTASRPATTNRPASAGHGHEYRYTMHLSATAATVRPGGVTTTVIRFEADRRLHGLPVNMTVIGLPAGATARFSPARARVGGHTTLTITTAPDAPAGTTTITVSAIIDLVSSDPIGTTAPFDLTISG